MSNHITINNTLAGNPAIEKVGKIHVPDPYLLSDLTESNPETVRMFVEEGLQLDSFEFCRVLHALGLKGEVDLLGTVHQCIMVLDSFFIYPEHSEKFLRVVEANKL